MGYETSNSEGKDFRANKDGEDFTEANEEFSAEIYPPIDNTSDRFFSTRENRLRGQLGEKGPTDWQQLLKNLTTGFETSNLPEPLPLKELRFTAEERLLPYEQNPLSELKYNPELPEILKKSLQERFNQEGEEER
jgi:hypothetical protein